MDNRIKTFLLMLVLTIIVMLIGSLFGRSGLIIALIFVAGMNLISYYFSDKIVLRIYGAKPALKKDYPKLHLMVDELSKSAGIPKPEIYIVPSRIENAFATGRNPKNGKVAVTEGIMHSLTEKELKGVLAHELSHIKHRDILIATIAATFAGLIMFVANMTRFAAIFGGMRDEGGNNLLGLLLVGILAPIAALLIQMAISRSREYMADEKAAILIKDGEPLASALLKLERGPKVSRGIETTSHLFIVNPLKGGGIVNLFSTHPPIEERVKRLRALKF